MFDIRETSLLGHFNQMRHSRVDEHGSQVRAVTYVFSPLSPMTLTTRSSLFSLSALNSLLTLLIVQRTDGDDDENCDKDNNALDPIYWRFSFKAGLTEILVKAKGQWMLQPERIVKSTGNNHQVPNLESVNSFQHTGTLSRSASHIKQSKVSLGG